MKENETISVVIPCRDSLGTLAETLTSLSEQSIAPTEIIIVDDGSRVPIVLTGDTLKSTIEKLEAQSVRVRVERFDASRGPAVARNTGASLCRESYVLFLDADVVAPRQTLTRIISTFAQQPDISAVQGIYTSHVPDDRSVPSRYQNHYYHHAFKSMTSDFPAVCATYCFAIKRAVFMNSNGFDESIHCPTVEDELFGYHLANLGHKIYLHRSLRVTHLAEYQYDSLILRKFRMSFNQVKSLLRGNKLPVGGVSKDNHTHHSRSVLAAVMLSPLLPLLWFSAWPAGFLFTLIYTGLNASFWSYLTRVEPMIYSAEMFFLTWVDQMTIFCGLAVGTVDYFLGRRE